MNSEEVARRWLSRWSWLLRWSGAAAGPHEAADGTDGETGELTGSITVQGSDTIVNLAQAWAETFQDENPGVTISVTGGGSGTGIASLINGTVDFANASREIKDEEKSSSPPTMASIPSSTRSPRTASP